MDKNGHFEKGVWIEESNSTSGCLIYTIRVDTSQMEDLEIKLKELRDLFAVAESMTTIWQRIRWLITGKVR